MCAGKQPGRVGTGTREVSPDSSEMLSFLPLGSNLSCLRDPRIQRTDSVPHTNTLTEVGGQTGDVPGKQSKTGRWQKRHLSGDLWSNNLHLFPPGFRTDSVGPIFLILTPPNLLETVKLQPSTRLPWRLHVKKYVGECFKNK